MASAPPPMQPWRRPAVFARSCRPRWPRACIGCGGCAPSSTRTSATRSTTSRRTGWPIPPTHGPSTSLRRMAPCYGATSPSPSRAAMPCPSPRVGPCSSMASPSRRAQLECLASSSRSARRGIRSPPGFSMPGTTSASTAWCSSAGVHAHSGWRPRPVVWPLRAPMAWPSASTQPSSGQPTPATPTGSGPLPPRAGG